ncbi:MAG: class I tRNA ligase family protein, partial [Alphaproteobacteria bacterium]|nr:class I tRNA ligase family protein [Alphaproteobacteria bacterium]
DYTNTIPYGDRSGVVVEPMLTDQWYCDAKTLAAPAIKAVDDGRVQFIPANWSKTYYEWMNNIQPWCISRQLWWGHQIPAWYGPEKSVFVAETEEEAYAEAKKRFGDGVKLERDPDVLDTWFSSALWPFSTLGWPDDVEEVKRYYPAETLVTGFDIIFFWVARMMMMGLHFMGDVPFRKVYMHALVRDEKGQKMSKTKGNVIDPLELIDTYGVDALRFTLTLLAAQGRDVKISPARVETNRNFTTKLWNAARFCEMNGCVLTTGYRPEENKHILNKWIVSELAVLSRNVSESLDAFRFNDTASHLYHFTWGTFCDWYIEFTKPLLSGSDESVKKEVRETTGWVLDQLLLLLNPVMPFLTEELHSHLLGKEEAEKDDWLQTKTWPEFEDRI